MGLEVVWGVAGTRPIWRPAGAAVQRRPQSDRQGLYLRDPAGVQPRRVVLLQSLLRHPRTQIEDSELRGRGGTGASFTGLFQGPILHTLTCGLPAESEVAAEIAASVTVFVGQTGFK